MDISPRLLKRPGRAARLPLRHSKLPGRGTRSARCAVLALAVAGVEGVAVYDGSLHEWAADPELPLVVQA